MKLVWQHDTSNIIAVGTLLGPGLSPGQLCCHADDKKSLGMVLCSAGGQASVAWARLPRGALDMLDIQTSVIEAKTQKLRATWTSTTAATHVADDLRDLRIERR